MKIAIKSISILLIILFSSFITCRKVNKIKKMKNRDHFVQEVMDHFQEYIRNDAKTLPFIDIINKLQETIKKNENNENIDRTIETFKLIYVLLVEYEKTNEKLPTCITKITYDNIIKPKKVNENIKEEFKKMTPDEFKNKMNEISQNLKNTSKSKQNDITNNMQKLKDNFAKFIEKITKTENAETLKSIMNDQIIDKEIDIDDYFSKCYTFINENKFFLFKFLSEKINKILNSETSFSEYSKNNEVSLNKEKTEMNEQNEQLDNNIFTIEEFDNCMSSQKKVDSPKVQIKKLRGALFRDFSNSLFRFYLNSLIAGLLSPIIILIILFKVVGNLAKRIFKYIKYNIL